MAQEIKVSELGTGTEYTFQSTTDATTIVLSDDMFAEVMAIKRLTKAINDLARKIQIN